MNLLEHLNQRDEVTAPAYALRMFEDRVLRPARDLGDRDVSLTFDRVGQDSEGTVLMRERHTGLVFTRDNVTSATFACGGSFSSDHVSVVIPMSQVEGRLSRLTTHTMGESQATGRWTVEVQRPWGYTEVVVSADTVQEARTIGLTAVREHDTHEVSGERDWSRVTSVAPRRVRSTEGTWAVGLHYLDPDDHEFEPRCSRKES